MGGSNGELSVKISWGAPCGKCRFHPLIKILITLTEMTYPNNAPPGLARIHKKNLFILATCQTLFTSAAVMLVAIGGLVGLALAPDKSLATVPPSAFVIGTALFALPARHRTKSSLREKRPTPSSDLKPDRATMRFAHCAQVLVRHTDR